jgi:hypothetical protein
MQDPQQNNNQNTGYSPTRALAASALQVGTGIALIGGTTGLAMVPGSVLIGAGLQSGLYTLFSLFTGKPIEPNKYSTSTIVGATTSGVVATASYGALVVGEIAGISIKGAAGAGTGMKIAINSVKSASRGILSHVTSGATERIVTGKKEILTQTLQPSALLKSAVCGVAASAASQAVHACDIAQVEIPDTTSGLANQATYVAAKAAIGGAAGATAAGLSQLATNVIEIEVTAGNPGPQRRSLTSGLIDAAFVGAALKESFLKNIMAKNPYFIQAASLGSVLGIFQRVYNTIFIISRSLFFFIVPLVIQIISLFVVVYAYFSITYLMMLSISLLIYFLVLIYGAKILDKTSLEVVNAKDQNLNLLSDCFINRLLIRFYNYENPQIEKYKSNLSIVS